MFKKILFSIFVAVLCVPTINISPVSAASNVDTTICTPTLTVKTIKKDYVTLRISCPSLKKTNVGIILEVINNDDSDGSETKKPNLKLNKSGTADIKISGLDTGTSYSFKAKIKKSGKKTYSAYSELVNATTKGGADYKPVIDSIKSITEDSVKLNISCDDLEDKSVNVQVASKKKSDWSTKTYDLDLDEDGEGSIKVEDLKSDTQYSFKIRIKKSSGDSYSAYSAIKNATTDEEE